MSNYPKIGLALGSGAGRGAAHIGVIRALKDLGIEPNIICGSSVGALVGAATITNKLNEIEDWFKTLKRRELIKVFDFYFRGGGVIKGDRAVKVLEDMNMDINIEDLPTPLGIVATDMHSGREIWLREGNLLQAIHASCAIPGMVAPVKLQNRWLIDGAVVNPIPVSLCKAMGAEVIFAVNILSSIRHNRIQTLQGGRKRKKKNIIPKTINEYINKWIYPQKEESEKADFKPQLFDVVNSAFDIMQEQIIKSRMAGDPPDFVFNPRLNNFGIFSFNKTEEAIEEGYQCVMRNKDAIFSVLYSEYITNIDHQDEFTAAPHPMFETNDFD